MHQGSPTRTRGFTLLEAIILLMILSIVALAAAVGLQGIAKATPANELQLAIASKLVDKMEEVRALDFDSLTLGTALSDTTSINEKTYVRTVAIALADADGSGDDADFKQITISINGQSLVTLVTQP